MKEKVTIDGEGCMKDRVSVHSTVSPRDELLFAALDRGEAAILSLQDGIYYGLNPVAALIWHLLEQRKNLIEIRELLLREFSVDSDRLTWDLIELIEQLAKLGLVEISPETTA